MTQLVVAGPLRELDLGDQDRLTHVQRLKTAGVIPWPHRPGLLSGRFTKGHEVPLIFCIPSYSVANAFSEKPVPTLPANRSPDGL